MVSPSIALTTCVDVFVNSSQGTYDSVPVLSKMLVKFFSNNSSVIVMLSGIIKYINGLFMIIIKMIKMTNLNIVTASNINKYY